MKLEPLYKASEFGRLSSGKPEQTVLSYTAMKDTFSISFQGQP